ncbi:hypothetical protein CTI12_AA239120 [Artemisia annua]|uniref:Helitron helicase-like domain-containing protein n=1 Tax=Artemisia annua TaxID=35608 RepID=A0A2U1N324_ARTAN|nr:hypothetical protein CTI12_AA239120 [Artemisia annua]
MERLFFRFVAIFLPGVAFYLHRLWPLSVMPCLGFAQLGKIRINPTNTHTSPQCKIHGPNVANVVASDSQGQQSSAASNTNDDYVHQGSVHHASQVQCLPPPVHTPASQHCSATASLQNNFTNDRLKNDGGLLQATGSSQQDGRCLHQPKKRGRPRKDKGPTEPIEGVGSPTSDGRCLQQPRKRVRPRKEILTKETANCDMPGGMCPVVGPSEQRRECLHPTNNIVTANVQSHNSHTESQTENQQLSLHQCKPSFCGIQPCILIVLFSFFSEAQKRNRDPEQFSRRRIRRRTSDAHVHAGGEPPTTETETTCVHTNGQPDAPQTCVVGPSEQRQECLHPINNIITANVQSHNSHTEPQTENQQLSLHQCKQAQKRNRDPGQFSRRRIRQRTSEAHLHAAGEPPTTETDFNGLELDPKIVQGLIHFLDAHNELVQLLRTARDKCAEPDVPEFKVRLYIGDRPRGYELPASQTLGAIVFDSGPESESNYDVILEYRNGVVKRVSKIHKSYMSLQFPLIFIYGQPGYHTKLMLRTADPNDEPKRHYLSFLIEPSAAPLALTDKDSTEEKKERQDEAHTTATLLSPPSESSKETKLPEDDLQQPNSPLLHNEASSALPRTPMDFIQQETLPPPLKEKAVQESKGKTVKRPLFQQQPTESKKQKVFYSIEYLTTTRGLHLTHITQGLT